MRSLFLLPLFAPMLALSACSSSIPPVEVTRFHLSQPFEKGAVTIVPAPGGAAESLEFRTYAAALAKAMAPLGFTGPSGQGVPLVAELDFSRGSRTEMARRSPVSIGVGGGSFGRGGGIGIGTSFGLGGGGSGEVIVSRLSVRIKQKSDGKALWEGRAETAASARSAAAQPGLAAEKLAMALFQDFPGQSGQTITIP
jgi:hypothetical protein